MSNVSLPSLLLFAFIRIDKGYGFIFYNTIWRDNGHIQILFFIQPVKIPVQHILFS